MRRRKVLALGAQASLFLTSPSLSAQARLLPFVGFVNFRHEEAGGAIREAFLRGLRDLGYIDGYNVVVEYAWSGGSAEKAEQIARDFVRRGAHVISGGGSTVAVVLRRVTGTIPIIFFSGGDPVELGLVASLSRPGGNATGVAQLTHSLGPKLLQFVQEVVPDRSGSVVILHKRNVSTPLDRADFEAAARHLSSPIEIFETTTPAEDELAIAAAKERRRSLVVGAGATFVARASRFVALAAEHRVPAFYTAREFVEAGGLMSYGSSIVAGYRQVGVYTGRILRGEKPHELPVVQPTELELVVNLKAATALGLSFPAHIIGQADEVIE